MKKPVAITMGVVIILAGGWLGATWYTGKRLETGLPAQIEEANRKLAEALPGYGARIETLAYERGFFGSRARYGIVVPGPNAAQDGPLLPPGLVEMESRIQHGPFPKAAVQRGEWLPRLGFVQSEMARTPGLARLYEASGGRAPLSGEMLISYNGNATGTMQWSPIDLREEGKGHFRFSGATLQASYVRAVRALEGTLSADALRLTTKDEAGASEVSLQGLTMQLATRLGKHDLSLGDTRVAIGQLALGEPESGLQLKMEDLSYDQNVGEDETTLHSRGIYRIGRLALGGADLGSVQAELSMDDFDGAATKRLLDSYQRALEPLWPLDPETPGAGGRPVPEGEAQARFNEMLDDLRAVLAAGPSIALDPVVWKTPKGESRLALSLALTQPSAEAKASLRALVRQSVKSLKASATLSKPMMEDLTARYLVAQGASAEDAGKEAADQIGMLSGMAELLKVGRNDGDNIVSVLQYAEGKATVNGREVPAEQIFGALPDTPPHRLLDTEAAPVEPLSISQLRAEDIKQLLEDAGYAASIEEDDAGDPLVRIEPEGTGAETMEIQFYDCEDQACDNILLSARYAQDRQASLETLNAWNRDNRWTRAYLGEDGRLMLEMDISAAGGIGVDNLSSQLAGFMDAVAGFNGEIPQQAKQ